MMSGLDTSNISLLNGLSPGLFQQVDYPSLLNPRNALLFNGTNTSISTNTNNIISNVTTYTMAAWIKLTTTTANQFIFGVNINNDDRGVGLLYISGVGIRCQQSNIGSGGGGATFTLPNPTELHHVGYIYDQNSGSTANSSKITCFLDGQPVSATYAGTITSNPILNLSIKIGSAASSRFVNGKIGPCAIWRNADPMHIINHYKNKIDKNELALDVRFNENNPSLFTRDENETLILRLINFTYDVTTNGFTELY